MAEEYPVWMYPEGREPALPPPQIAADELAWAPPGAETRERQLAVELLLDQAEQQGGLRLQPARSDAEYIVREAFKRAALAYPPARLPAALLSLLEDQPPPGTLSPPVESGRDYLAWLERLAAALGWRGRLNVPQGSGTWAQMQQVDPVQLLKDIQAGRHYTPPQAPPQRPLRSLENAMTKRMARRATETMPAPPSKDPYWPLYGRPEGYE